MRKQFFVPCHPRFLGRYTTVQVSLQTVRNVLTVPIQAVQRSGHQRGSVLNKIQGRDVTLGLRSATAMEVRSGIAENELVLFGKQSHYKPGAYVPPARTCQWKWSRFRCPHSR